MAVVVVVVGEGTAAAVAAAVIVVVEGGAGVGEARVGPGQTCADAADSAGDTQPSKLSQKRKA